MPQKQIETRLTLTLDGTAETRRRRGLRPVVRTAIVFGLAFLAAVECGYGQAPQTAGATDALHAMSRLAAVIFTGQVAAVRRHDAADGAAGMVEIDFAVEDAVRGVSGGIYTLREWAGLWPAGDQPFSVGQRLLMLLHAPGVAGLSSPVGGSDGAIPIRGSGPAPPANATDSRVVDLRWIETRVVRPIVYRVTERQTALPVSARPRMNVVAGLTQEEAGPSAAAVPGSQGTADVPSAPQSVAYTSVLALLRSWVKEDDAAR
jgi:hypothetical protein